MTDRPVSPPSELTDVVERILIRLPWEERAALRAEWHAALDAARAAPQADADYVTVLRSEYSEMLRAATDSCHRCQPDDPGYAAARLRAAQEKAR